MENQSNSESTTVRENILIVASVLFTEKGVKNTSLADIAKVVGISKGTLYYYYSSKADIIYDITDIHLNSITQELLTWISSVERDTAPEQILKVVFEKIINAETRGKLHLYLISDAVIGNESYRERFRQRYREWREMIESGLKVVFKGKVVNHDTLSHLILAALDGFVIQRMLGVQQIPLEGIAKGLSVNWCD